MKLSPQVKVGILTLISILIVIFGVMWLKGRSMSAGERTEVLFHDIDGMRPGSAIQMMGIRIGQVEDVIPVVQNENSYVKVRFVITEPDIKIPDASVISIQQSGIIGEKFLEITPPQVQNVLIPMKNNLNCQLKIGSPVELLVSGKYIPVGYIKSFKIIDSRTLSSEDRKQIRTPYTYKIDYLVTKPGYAVPRYSSFSLNSTDSYCELKITPPENVILEMPELESKYTVIEPIRLREFFDIQLESAAALKETNDRINKLLSDKFIDDIKITLDNTKDFSEKASDVMTQASDILASSKGDITKLISLSAKLSDNLIVLSDNLNTIVGDKEFKSSLVSTVQSMQKSSDEISALLNDSKLQDTLLNINSTSQNLSDVTKYVNDLTQNKDFNNKIDQTITNLNVSLEKLSQVMDTVDDLTTEQKCKIQRILDNSETISKDMKKFSNKLNKRFLLLRLLF
jgi:ABC-type transporter Mla subunit MlaD